MGPTLIKKAKYTDDNLKVQKYYQSFGSRFGYNLVMKGYKHFGYYPDGVRNISEFTAQVNQQDNVAKKLKLKRGQRILDAGCGQGRVSAYLAKKYGVHVTGITIVPFEKKNCISYAKKEGVEGLTEYRVEDYSKTSFPDNSFDAIYTTETLSHSPDLGKTLDELHRILKPGGRVAFFEYTPKDKSLFTDEDLELVDKLVDISAMMSLQDIGYDSFSSKMEKAGFTEVDKEDISKFVAPSMKRLSILAAKPYKILKTIRLPFLFTNTVLGYEFYRLYEDGKYAYCIFSARKPKKRKKDKDRLN